MAEKKRKENQQKRVDKKQKRDDEKQKMEYEDQLYEWWRLGASRRRRVKRQAERRARVAKKNALIKLN